ncbi:MAG: TonB-dependent receptor [Bacteroidota bacterium]
MKKLATALAILLVQAWAFAQTGEIRGRITDAESNGPLVGATTTLVGTTMGASTDANGEYAIRNIPAGNYRFRVAYVGYITIERRVTVGTDVLTLDLTLQPTTIEAGEVVVEVNRARDRETPVAFSDIGKMEIEQKIHGQDAPLLIQGTPGVYSYSTDGVGNGEAKIFVRGFTQNYVQVLINGVPTNDPESNAVYWSNWGSVSSAAASIQVQRGAGSSLYGAGSFGGSFNIVTAEASPKRYFGANLSLGDPLNSMYGLQINTGLINTKFAGTFRLDRKVAEGSRISGRYEGVNYYGSLAWYINEQQSLKLVLHGAPQKHGYSFSSDISYFKKYGYNANAAPFLPRYVVDALPTNINSGEANYGLLDDRRELVDSRYVNLSHNFFHKPQLELHYRYDIGPNTSLAVTGFYSMGRGAGSSITGGGTTFRRFSDGSIFTLLGDNGTITSPTVAINTYLANAAQRISYSLHQQGGILANLDLRPAEFLKLTVGGEFRSWTADHPGHFTNLFGKTSYTTSYAGRDSVGSIASFSRRVYQGDLDAPGDLGNIFAWKLANNDPTYRSQYRNYRGETPQYTIFAQGNWLLNKLNVITSIQYVWYRYKLIENMPSENAIGQRINVADVAARGITKEGPIGNNKFIMLGTNGRWYEFDLVNANRSRGFLQPKFGLNYNFDENLNVFANFAHVERFVDLGVYYNQGRVDPSVGDEKSNQYEVGVGWTSPDVRGKINGYMMSWDNKSARIQDQSKAGQPGYDRNGYRSELIGKSLHKGIEVEASLNLERWVLRGLELTGSFTYMENKWKEVLAIAKTDPITGARRPFATGVLNSNGTSRTIYFDELENTPVASGPQTMAMLALNYRDETWFAGVNLNYYARQWLLDGGTYLAVDGYYAFTNAGKVQFFPTFDNKLPAYATLNANVGTRFTIAGISAQASVQAINILDKDHLVDADRFGVIPGPGQTWRFNIGAGF